MTGSTTRTGRFVRGLSLGYISMGLTLVVGLWLTPFFLRHLGQEDYGVWLMIGQAMTYLGLMDLGVVALMPRETAFAVGRAGRPEDAADLPEIVGRTIRLVLWQLPFVAAIATLAWFLFPGPIRGAAGPLAWLLVLFVIRFPIRIFQEVLVGLQDLAFIGKIQLVGFILTTATTVGLVLAGWNLYALVVGWGIGQLIPALVSFVRLRWRYPFALPTSLPNLPWKTAKRLLSNGGWVSVAQLAHLFVYGSDVLILGYLLGPAAVVPYVCTGKLVSVLQHQPNLIMETARPALSELRASHERDRLHSVTSALTLLALLLGGLIACGVAATNRGFTILWVGESLFGGATLTVALVAIMLLRLWNATAINAIFAFGYERRISSTLLADGVLTCGLMVVLVPRIGLIGAPIASMIAVVLVSLPWNLSALAREGDVTLIRQVLGLANWFVRFAAVIGLTVWVEHVTAPRRIYALVAAGVAVTCAYILVMLPLARRPPLTEYVRPFVAGLKSRFSAFTRRRDASP